MVNPEIYSILSLNFSGRNNFDLALKKILEAHPLINKHLRKLMTSTLGDKEIKMEEFKVKTTEKNLKLFKWVCHYFSCLPMYSPYRVIAVGFEDDPKICIYYFYFLNTNLQITIKALRKIHVVKTQKERYKRRRGLPHKKIIHGSTFASNIEDKLLCSYYNIFSKLLQEQKMINPDLYQYNQAKIRTIQTHESNIVQEPILRNNI